MRSRIGNGTNTPWDGTENEENNMKIEIKEE